METYVEALDGDIVLKFKKFHVEEGENEISFSVQQNFIYSFSNAVSEAHASDRGKSVIYLIIGELLVPSLTGKDMLLDSDGKIRMQYVVSDPDPDFWDGRRVTMAVVLIASKTVVFVALCFICESGGMVGYQAAIVILQ